MHNNGEDGQQQQQTPTSSMALGGGGEPTETAQPFVTSVSQYGIIQPNEVSEGDSFSVSFCPIVLVARFTGPSR